MRLIWQYMQKYIKRIAGAMSLKLLSTLTELSLPYILEHIIDNIVPLGELKLVLYWGFLMIFMALLTRQMNVAANRTAVSVSRDGIFELRDDLFRKTINLSGARFDSFSLPSLTSRMTSDTYNVQNFMTRIQTIGIRGPIMLLGGIALTLTMDVPLSLILITMVPILLTVVLTVSIRGIPLYDRVQKSLDDVVRIMRENITGIRVVKALSREDYEMRRYAGVNKTFTDNDVYANEIMALPGPFMQLCLNVGLTLVIIVGAKRVNAGHMQPGVILAFLTYFNLILQAVMGLNRIFVMSAKATASADRIALILADPDDQPVIADPLAADAGGDAASAGEIPEGRKQEPEVMTDGTPHILFDHVSFSYNASESDRKDREKCLYDISFALKHGESLGIIGATGCGKTTVINLLMRFYDTGEGRVTVDGRDVRSFNKDELRRKFGVVFQNDIIFADTLWNNIDFGRDLSEENVRRATEDAGAAEFIDALPDGYEHMAAIKGANLSGGQKQRVLIARALAGKPEILILDDASSALDYQTDAAVRKAIRRDYADTTTIMIAQRISSVMNLTHIMVLEDGRMLDYGTHEELLSRCALYKEIYDSQMGEL